MCLRAHSLKLAFLFALASCSCSKTADLEATSAVRAVMEEQQAAWNRGDIDAFMNGYERADTTTFVSGGELTRGWQTVLDRYKKRYNSREQMGTLTFSELEVKPLGPLYVLADGRWQLKRANDAPGGRFTLVFQ